MDSVTTLVVKSVKVCQDVLGSSNSVIVENVFAAVTIVASTQVTCDNLLKHMCNV